MARSSIVRKSGIKNLAHALPIPIRKGREGWGTLRVGRADEIESLEISCDLCMLESSLSESRSNPRCIE
jgi:hypothetical protein